MTSSNTPSRSTPLTAWLTLFVLATAGFLALAVELSPAGLLTRMAPDLGSDVATAGSLTALYSVGNAVLVIPLTAWVLRFNRRNVLSAALLIFALSNVAVAVSSELAPALVARFVAGGAHGLLMVLSPVVAMRVVHPDHRGKALAIVIGANTVGIAVGAPLTSIIGTTFGWQATFHAAAGLALICAVLLWVTVPSFRTQREARVSIMETLRQPGVGRLAVAWALMMMGYLGVITYIDPYLAELGAPPVLVSGALFVFGVAGLIGVWAAARIASKSRMIALVSMPSVMVVALAAMALAISNIGIILLLLAFWGAGFAGAILINQQVLLQVGWRAPETAGSIGVVFSQAGMAVGSVLGGVVLSTTGVLTVPLLGAVSIAVAMLLFIGLSKTVRHATQDQAKSENEQQLVPALGS
ncbi:MFS transporter [Arthrobacter sp. JZ12]|uniref:MFS transporter n=1 Tax=Arthrobacter sp. JZ12 TaxID=2654190 RepID=UPI002B467E8C|nr:MFS transporter [Arthrobacter sp. JZ12]WRH25323.1 MFS transporter [Arthrobacter sp. JZ12]